MDLNATLVKTYRQHWTNLQSVLRETDNVEKNFTYPLLINIFPEYLIAPVKLFVVGQQTRGWQKKTEGDAITYLIQRYEHFHLGQRYRRTPFWQACHQLNLKLNPDGPQYGFIWSNLIKIDQNKHRPVAEIEEKVCTAFPVLPLEIQISRPDVVVFFTGPNYDFRLKKTFYGLTFQAIAGYKVRTLARVIHNSLPYNSFRTYHPAYIRRSKQLLLEEIVSKIVTSFQEGK
jgi:hypothetical protein